jgi:thiol-disulfide isomerase/thioredoxin
MSGKYRVLLAGCFALLSMALVSTAQADKKSKALGVGDSAPALKVAKWVKGSPVAKFEKGKVYVVEFWATWCGPCLQTIPHLTELAQKYKGKVQFTGVSVFEERNPTDESYISKVVKFVKDMGDKMNYTVAVDGKEGIMGKTWMEAANQNGIPTAFVVGKDQKIAWIGHPMSDMERVLEEVVSDKFDIKKEAEKQARAAEEERKSRAMMQPLNNALRQNRFADALKEIDKILEVRPAMAMNLLPLKYQLLLRTDEPAAYKLAKELSEGKYKDNAAMLNQLAWLIVDDNIKLKKPDYDLSIAIAERAVELTKGEDPMILDTLAYGVFKKGNVNRAIELQTKALSMMNGKKEYPEGMKEEMSERLKLFKSKKS